MSTLIILIIVVLALSGFFSGSEAALISLRSAEVETLVREKRRGSKLLARVHKSLDQSVMTILIFNNIVNIMGSIFVGQMVIKLYGDAVLAVITTGLTFGIIIFSEILPKSLGIHYSVKFSRAIAPFILSLTLLMYPLIFVLTKITRSLKHGERKVGTEDQIRSLVAIGRRAGHIEIDEGQLIHRAFLLNDKTAKDIMTPLKDIISLEIDSSIEEATEKVIHNPFSRYPVFGSSIHDVQGTVIGRDLLASYFENKEELDLSSVMREPLVIDANIHSDSLLILFREEEKHLAVVQEKGKTVGVVTLEDVLEELIGEIKDETDTKEDLYEPDQ
ncbi:hemolysin family protein [Patescibacteria group bacterium]|nr:hemolysin family protein [Patescibacteria group bacterium]MBU2259509.1 hemolysin family protein [Patescibacteria group bacterium]